MFRLQILDESMINYNKIYLQRRIPMEQQVNIKHIINLAFKNITPVFLIVGISTFSLIYTEFINIKQQIEVLQYQIEMVIQTNEDCQNDIYILNKDIEAILSESENNNVNINQSSEELKKIEERLSVLENKLNDIEQKTINNEQETLDDLTDDLTSIENISNNNNNNDNAIIVCIISGIFALLAYTLQPFSKKLADRCFPDKMETKNNDNEN